MGHLYLRCQTPSTIGYGGERLLVEYAASAVRLTLGPGDGERHFTIARIGDSVTVAPGQVITWSDKQGRNLRLGFTGECTVQRFSPAYHCCGNLLIDFPYIALHPNAIFSCPTCGRAWLLPKRAENWDALPIRLKITFADLAAHWGVVGITDRKVLKQTIAQREADVPRRLEVPLPLPVHLVR